MSLKSQCFQSLQAGFILLILAVMVCAECVLISENAAFLQSQGKGPFPAFALAACVALLIPIASAFRVSRRNGEPMLWPMIGKWIFVSALVGLQVWFASQTAIAPQLAQVMRESDRVLIAEYQAQIRQYDSRIAEFQKRVDAYSDRYRSKKSELTAEQADLADARRTTLSELRTVTESAGSEPTGIQAVFRNSTLAATVLYRLALETGVIFLAVCLRRQFGEMPAASADDAGKMRSVRIAESLIPADMQTVPEISQTGTDQEPEENSPNPRAFVLLQFPGAVCKSANGRKGPFSVYADSTEKTLLGRSRSNVDAWESAAQRIKERRAA